MKSAAWLAIGAIVAIVLVVVLVFGSSGRFVVRTIDYVVTNLVNVSGLSPFLARGLVTLATIPFFWAVAKYTRGVVGYRRLKPSLALYTNKYGIIIVCYVAAFFLAMYFGSRQSYYGLTSGEVLKWCAESPEGIRVFDSPGVDPVYGSRLAPCTAEQIIALRAEKLDLKRPQLLSIESPGQADFFDALSGRPKVWYWRAPTGAYEFFDRPGRHPRTNAELLPVTAEVVTDFTRSKADEATAKAQLLAANEAANARREEAAKRDAAEAERLAHRQKYVNPSTQGRSAVVVLAVSVKGMDDVLTAALAAAVRGRSDILKPAFVRDGLFTRALDGDTSAFRDLDLDRAASWIVLGSIRLSTSFSSAYGERLVKSEARIALRVFDTAADFASRTSTATGSGAGFSEAVAETQATNEAINRAIAYLNTVVK